MEECKGECKAGAQLSGLLDKELTEEEQCELRQHLESCPQCRDLFRELEELERCLCTLSAPCPVVWDALWQAVAQELPPACKLRRGRLASVLDRLHGAPASLTRAPRWFSEGRFRWALTAAAAAGVLALLVGLWQVQSILSGGHGGSPGPAPSAHGGGVVALAPADTLEVELDQSEGEPGALLLVSADGKTAVVWVMSDQPDLPVPGI